MVANWKKVLLLVLALATHKKMFENSRNAPRYRHVPMPAFVVGTTGVS